MANILCIVQDETLQALIQTTLEKQHQLIWAAEASLAVQYCAMLQPDLIVVDFTDTQVDSQELATRLKMFMPQTPLLRIVASTGPEVILPSFASEVDEVLAKPLLPAELSQKVAQLISPRASLLSEFGHSLSDTANRQIEGQIASLNQANQRLASLNAVSALIGTSLDLEHLTDEILVQIDKIIDFDSATLFLLKGDVLEAAASRGLLDFRRGMNTYHRSEHNSAWQVVAHKLPMIIGDVTTSEYWESRPELSQVRSWLGVPLIYKERVVGVLTLDKNEPEAFSEADARYLFTLTYQMAVAVENAQLFQEWEKQSTRLKLINEVGQEIGTILDIKRLFQTLGRAIFERLRYDQVAIFSVDDIRAVLDLETIYGEGSPQFKPDVYHLKIKNTLEQRVIESAGPVLLNHLPATDWPPHLEAAGIQSILLMPIFVGQRIDAVISAGCCDVNGFSDLDLWTLSSLAHQAAIVIENARLYSEVQTYSGKLERLVEARTQRLQAIKKVSQVASQGLLVDELLPLVGQKVSQIFATDKSEVVQVAVGFRQGSYLSTRVIYNSAYKSEPDLQATRFKIDPTKPMGYVVSEAKPLILRNGWLEDAPPPASGGGGGLGWTFMLAPLIAGGKTIGLIRVKSNQANAFDEGDLETLEALAFQVASAVEQARLLQKTKEMAIVEERTRLASDMHDGVAQNLAYLMLQIDRCLTMVDKNDRLEAQLEKVSDLLRQNIDELRRNIFDLRPLDLEGRSFSEAIEQFVTEFGRRWGLETHCQVLGEAATELLPEVESGLYRILQESLANVRQHARCTRLTVRLYLDDDQWVTLKVSDDGQGFIPNRRDLPLNERTHRGLGLASMHERAERLGGKMMIESNVGQGTCILTKLPLKTQLTPIKT